MKTLKDMIAEVIKYDREHNYGRTPEEVAEEIELGVAADISDMPDEVLQP